MNEKKKHDPSAGILSVSGCGTGGWKPPADHAQIHYETESENVTRIQLQKGTLIKILSIINVCFRYWTMESAMDIRKRWTSFQSMGKTAWLRSSAIDGNGMGDRMNELLGEHMGYLEGVPIIRRESKKIAGLFEKTYHEVLQELWDCQVLIRETGQKGAFAGFFLCDLS